MRLEWINPVALAGLVALAGPIVIHLLRRRRATRVPFPTVRFLVPSRAAAVRIKSPADPWLLALRLTILAVAALAWSQPAIVTDPGRAQREQSVARAIVIDRSSSMDPVSREAREAISAERAGATSLIEVETDDIGDGVRDAIEQLSGAPPARREIVVISDFQHGALDASDVAAVDGDVGLRFVAVGRPLRGRPQDQASGIGQPAPAVLRDAQASLAAPGVAGLVQTIELDGRSTRVKVRNAEPGSHAPRIIVAEDQSASIDALLRSVARAGAPALPPNRSVVVAFPGAPRLAGISSPREDWMLRAIVRIRTDRSLREAVAKSPGISEKIETRWVTVAFNENGQPVGLVAALAGELVMRMSTSPSDFASAAALRALLRGVVADHAWHEYEVERIPAATLQAWSRPAGSIPQDRLRQTAPGDARGFWAGVLLLLGGESVMRGRNRSRAEREHRRAA